MAKLEPSIKVAVIGAGAMGSGIAHVAARAGHTVYLYDMNPDAVTRGKAGIEKDLRFLVGKGKLAEADANAALDRVVPSSELQDLADAGLLIEAIVENMEIKQKLFGQLEDLVGADAILATNTSSLSITAMASTLKRPERLAGLHFFNPAPRMALVEIVSGLATGPQIAATLYDTAKAWGKVPVHATSTPGFIVNRVARPYYAEGLRVLAERAATPATIDAIMRETCNFPMGPFELMDLIGHDVNYAVTRSVFDAYFGDKRFTPSLIQQERVLAGRLGRKNGQGFYDYREGAERPAPQDEAAATGVASVTVRGSLGVAEPLVARLEAAGIRVTRTEGEGDLLIGRARVALTDGRTATLRAVEEGTPELVLFDLARDYAATPRLALAAADQSSREAWQEVVGTFQAAGLVINRVDDIAGMVAMRTVCMLANEAADGVVQGIASPADIDTAMRYGTNYPEGPLAWADRLGVAYVARVLQALRDHYGEERYRLSPLIRRRALTHGSLCA